MTNCEKIYVSGRKAEQKTSVPVRPLSDPSRELILRSSMSRYFKQSTFPGNSRHFSYREVMQRRPEDVRYFSPDFLDCPSDHSVISLPPDHHARRLLHAPQKQAAPAPPRSSEGLPGRHEPLRGQHRQAVRPRARRQPAREQPADPALDRASRLERIRAPEAQRAILRDERGCPRSLSISLSCPAFPFCSSSSNFTWNESG